MKFTCMLKRLLVSLRIDMRPGPIIEQQLYRHKQDVDTYIHTIASQA